MKGALVAAALISVVNAECPASCSGSGTCGTNDQCTCYAGYRGNDCAARTCPFAKSWVMTPQGDLNFDGDTYDAAVYTTSEVFTTRPHVVTDYQNGGTWESAPSYLTTGEGHEIMECSNAGLCDREQGKCQCFEGYEGTACNRMSCPGGNTCNGHGLCLTIDQLVAEYNIENGATRYYTNWDEDMSRLCKCDPGFEGVGCMDRKCPRGDDPLTKVHQIDDVQYIDIYSNEVGETNSEILGGTFTLTFKTLDGEEFTTAPIDALVYEGSTDADVNKANAVKAALEALPNKVIPSITVEARYCETPKSGLFKADCDSATTNGGTAFTNGEFCRLPGLAGADKNALRKVGATSGTAWRGSYDFSTASDGVYATLITYPQCVRYAIRFSDEANSGPQNLLSVDVTGVTYDGLLNSQRTADKVASTVSKAPALVVADASRSVGYKKGQGVDVTIAAAGALTGSSMTITAAGFDIPAGALIKIYCAAGNIYIGEYTVAATVASIGTTVTIASNVNDPQDVCAAGVAKKFTIQSNWLISSADLSLGAATAPIISDGVGFTLDSTEVRAAASAVTAYASGKQYVILAEQPKVDGVAISDAAAADVVLKVSGAGTKESSVCGDRGICDKETGQCQCFKGYSGQACARQNALAQGIGN